MKKKQMNKWKKSILKNLDAFFPCTIPSTLLEWTFCFIIVYHQTKKVKNEKQTNIFQLVISPVGKV